MENKYTATPFTTNLNLANGKTFKWVPQLKSILWRSFCAARVIKSTFLLTTGKYSRTSKKLLITVWEFHSIGTGDPSDNLNTKTKGEKPVMPSADEFIEVKSNSITLHLAKWSDGGCPMLYFVIEHKKK